MFDRLAQLAACLCRQIEQDGLPATCFCGVVPGEAAIQEYAGNCNEACGMAWVRLVSLFPAAGVNIPDETVGNCGKELNALIEVGIMRCAPGPDSRGNPPTASALLDAADLSIKDALAIRRAITCCEAFSSKDYMLGSYTPMGPTGGLVGGAWDMSVI